MKTEKVVNLVPLIISNEAPWKDKSGLLSMDENRVLMMDENGVLFYEKLLPRIG